MICNFMIFLEYVGSRASLSAFKTGNLLRLPVLLGEEPQGFNREARLPISEQSGGSDYIDDKNVKELIALQRYGGIGLIGCNLSTHLKNIW